MVASRMARATSQGLRARVTFMGSGSSAGCPVIRCIVQDDIHCQVCEAAAADPQSVYHRGPPMLLVEVADKGGPTGFAGDKTVVLIDCGPGFKSNAVRFLPKLNVHHLDAVALTHDHYDAVSSLNDLREIQAASCPPGVWQVEQTLPVYANGRAKDTVTAMFPYLFTGTNHATLVGKLSLEPALPGVPIVVKGSHPFELVPFEVEHGTGYACLGYLFGTESTVAYISDISRMPEDTLAVLQKTGVDILILDAIAHQARPSHFSLSQAQNLIRILEPKQQCYLVGMSCSLDHYETNSFLLSQDLPCPVELSYDGLSFEIDL